jgi:uncharacterized protein
MAITDEKYILFTTFRRNGDRVSSPVWIAPLANGRAGFTTDLVCGKTKRIANNPQVELQACGMRGALKADSVVVHATATVISGDEMREVRDAITKKYGVPGRLAAIYERVAARIRGNKPSSTGGIILRFDA